MRADLRVLVTGVGGGSVGAQILKALLMDDAFSVVAATSETPSIAERWVSDVLRLPRADSAEYLDHTGFPTPLGRTTSAAGMELPGSEGRLWSTDCRARQGATRHR